MSLSTLEKQLATLEGELLNAETILADESISDNDYDFYHSEAIRLSSEKTTLRSQISSLKCDLRIAEKLQEQEAVQQTQEENQMFDTIMYQLENNLPLLRVVNELNDYIGDYRALTTTQQTDVAVTVAQQAKNGLNAKCYERFVFAVMESNWPARQKADFTVQLVKACNS